MNGQVSKKAVVLGVILAALGAGVGCSGLEGAGRNENGNNGGGPNGTNPPASSPTDTPSATPTSTPGTTQNGTGSETEPNDTKAQATDLGGPGAFNLSGKCAAGDPADWYKVSAPSGALELQFQTHWVSNGNNSLTLIVHSEADGGTSQSSFGAGDDGVSSIQYSTGASDTFYLEIRCPGDAVVDYSGSLLIS